MTYNLKNNNTGVLIHADVIEDEAKEQVNLISQHPAIQGLVAIMPDVHAGAGCVIGFTGRFKKAVIPNIVGVDIGCGVLTYKLGQPSFKDGKGHLIFDMADFDKFVRENIPMGFNSRTSEEYVSDNLKTVESAVDFLKDRGLKGNPTRQLGTLGGGNHFIEIEKEPNSKDDILYLTIHCGSRNFGKQVAEYYQRLAKDICEDMNIETPKDLEYLPMSAGGAEYMKYLHIAQQYASMNRQMILFKLLQFFRVGYDKSNVIESVHNYIDGSGIIRKGAISARLNEQVVIPLNMGEGIVLGVGKGNVNYNFSAPHGAGRVSGRKDMFRKLDRGDYSMEDYRRVMQGIFSTSVCRETFDESPFAYKSYSNIEKHLNETVNVKGVLKPIYNIKAGGE